MHRNESKTTGIEPYIIECICLRLHEKEALSYLSERGYDISASELYRLKNDVKDNRQLRLNHIASEEFLMQHLDRIENLKAIEGELWNQYHLEKHPTNKSKILMNIAELQTYLSSYYDHTQYIMQTAARANGKFTVSKQQEKN
ncbi:MAG: hypothetical protein ACRD93_02320 [Nitrososphaeraceae archaeon]